MVDIDFISTLYMAECYYLYADSIHADRLCQPKAQTCVLAVAFARLRKAILIYSRGHDEKKFHYLTFNVTRETSQKKWSPLEHRA